MEVCRTCKGPGNGWSLRQTAWKARKKIERMGDGPRWWVDRVRNRRRTRDLSPFLIWLHNGVQLRIGLIRLGNGQHAVWMHSALPRLGFIPLGCRTGGRAWNTWETTAKWKPYTGSEGLEGVGSESDPERSGIGLGRGSLPKGAPCRARQYLVLLLLLWNDIIVCRLEWLISWIASLQCLFFYIQYIKVDIQELGFRISMSTFGFKYQLLGKSSTFWG